MKSLSLMINLMMFPEGMIKVEIKGKETLVKDEPFLKEAIEAGGYDPNYTGKNKKSAEQFV